MISIMSLLSDPVMDDPLVPEIAAQFIHEKDVYIQTAKLYTERYATGEKPNDEKLEVARGMNLKEMKERNDRERVSREEERLEREESEKRERYQSMGDGELLHRRIRERERRERFQREMEERRVSLPPPDLPIRPTPRERRHLFRSRE
jgi:hypothetical protein